VNTEITETNKGWVFYDGECALCRGWVERTYAIVLRRGYHFVPLQTPFARARLGLEADEPLREMKLLTARGNIFGGADALVQIVRAIWWLWPFYAFAQVPGVQPLLRILYHRLAANRHCLGNQCKLAEGWAEHSGAITSALYELP
jgi:predicted DCC family thiol-disulfide oxidoreductase YuxK